jgi:hypothetical protein
MQTVISNSKKTTMQKLILTNYEENNLKKVISNFAYKADKIKIASAFFSNTKLINEWLNNSKQVDLLVSLRPPTNYYSLKSVQSNIGITIQFLGDDFHSKFFIFYNNGQPFACIIGSSNFTAGGLYKNIETNAIFTDTKYLQEIDIQFSSLWERSFSLQPTDLANFKTVFDNFQKREKETEKDQAEFEKKILTKRANQKKKSKIGKEAKLYFAFWRVIDEVKEMVNDISEQEYPKVPAYISIDHFWHWIKVVWAKENRSKPTIANRKTVIPKLFKEYCDWDKSTGNHTKKMAETSKTMFSKLLSKSNIDNLTKDDARQIYANLHSGGMRTRRFGADKKFIIENSIQKIRNSFKYLLYSNDELDLRIHNLCSNPKFKLSQFSSSSIQELIGWVTPDKYPMRNKKAYESLKLLAYELK